MKINELNGYLKVDESELLGDFGQALVQKATGKAGEKSVKSQMAKNSFIQNFVDDALSGLEDAIESGTVDPNSKDEPSKVDPNTVQPQQDQQQQDQQQQDQQQQQQKKGQSQADRRKSIQQLNNYIKKIAQNIKAENNPQEKMKRVKEVINVMADRKDYPEWDNAKKAVQNIIQNADIDKAFAGSAVKRLETGQTMTEAWKIYFINKLLEYTNFSWDDTGFAVLKESNNYYLVESLEYEFESLFESLINEEDKKKTVAQWLTNWFSNYARGIDISDHKDHISSLINAVQWPAKKAKPALQKLGKAAWGIAKEQGADKVDQGQPQQQGRQQKQDQDQESDNQTSDQSSQQQKQDQKQDQESDNQTSDQSSQQQKQDQKQDQKAGAPEAEELYQKIKTDVNNLKVTNSQAFQSLVKELEK
jgi:hypothetical protein